MEDSNIIQNAPEASTEGSATRRQRRRVSIIGVAFRLLAAVVILLGAGIGAVMLINSKPEAIKRQPRERTFTVSVAEPLVADNSVTFHAFGRVIAGRDIAMRAQVQGEVVEIAPNLAVGNIVEQGALMLAVDPYDYNSALTNAQALYADANLSLAEARETLKLQQSKLESAKTNLSVARRDLERAQTLNKSGSLTDKDVETRELAVSERQQAVAELETTIFTQNAQIDRQRANVVSTRSGVEEAERNLANTRITAPFTGIVQSESVGLGSYVTANDTVVSLYDPKQLEVSFTISDQQYGQLLAEGLEGRAIKASWNIDPTPISAAGTITRTGAEVDSTTGGVALFAKLNNEGGQRLRPGTFVEVEIAGPNFPKSLRIPETAIYENDHFYTIRDGRMAKIDAKILIRDGDALIVAADVPAGERLITTRLTQAGEGVAVTVEGEAPQPSLGRAGGAGAGGLPPGAVRNEDGSITLSNGNIRRTDGSILMPDGKVISAEEAAKLRQQRGQNRPGGN